MVQQGEAYEQIILGIEKNIENDIQVSYPTYETCPSHKYTTTL